jgi:hypothetical protein
MRRSLSAILVFGLLACDGFAGLARTYYVSTNGLNIAPYTNWATAARSIQNAINQWKVNTDTVLVNDGIYTVTSPLMLTNWMTLRSVNPPSRIRPGF